MFGDPQRYAEREDSEEEPDEGDDRDAEESERSGHPRTIQIFTVFRT